MEKSLRMTDDREDFVLDELLHPAHAFSHPTEVVNDPDLTLNEKRAILASWASDACAVESAPSLRRPDRSGKPVTFDEIMDALRMLDACANKESAQYRRAVRKRWMSDRGSGSRGQPQL